MTFSADLDEITPQVASRIHHRAALHALDRGDWAHVTTADYGEDNDLSFVVTKDKRSCHETLDRILGPTFGFVAFREQILALAEAVSDFDRTDLAALWALLPKLDYLDGTDPTGGIEPDSLDGVMLFSLRTAFIARRCNPWTEDEARRLWELMVHSASSSMPVADAYRSAALAIAKECATDLWSVDVRAAAGQEAD